MTMPKEQAFVPFVHAHVITPNFALLWRRKNRCRSPVAYSCGWARGCGLAGRGVGWASDNTALGPGPNDCHPTTSNANEMIHCIRKVWMLGWDDFDTLRPQYYYGTSTAVALTLHVEFYGGVASVK